MCFEDRKRAGESHGHRTSASNATTKTSHSKKSHNDPTSSKNKMQEQVVLTPEEKKKKRFDVSIKLLDLSTKDEVVEDKYKDWQE